MSESRADLRACPFCGDGNARLEEGDYGQMVSCHPRSGCGAVTGYYETETEAAKAWNRRALADTQNPEPQLALNKRYAEGFFQGYEQAKRDYLIESTAKAVLRPAGGDRDDTAPGKYQAEEGVWVLTSPSGKEWRAESPLRVCALEQRERVPARVALARIYAALDEPPPVDDAYVAVGCERFSDGAPQTEASLDAALAETQRPEPSLLLTDQDIEDLAGGGIPNDLPARCKAFIAAVRSETQRSSSGARSDEKESGAQP